MAEHMDLYTDCPDCESRGYDTDTRICKRCIGTTFIPVRVKALEWQPWSITEDASWLYRISHLADRVYVATYMGQAFAELPFYASLSAAQAACQAHHERMVMDMLEVVP